MLTTMLAQNDVIFLHHHVKLTFYSKSQLFSAPKIPRISHSHPINLNHVLLQSNYVDGTCFVCKKQVGSRTKPLCFGIVTTFEFDDIVFGCAPPIKGG